MANRTDPAAKDIRGTNPQNLVEKILRTKIYQSTYWKEHCFGLSIETLVDKALELDHLGGDDGNGKPTPFMCLVLKMLQIQPEKEIVVEFIIREYKYVRVLGAFYLRLTGTDADVYRYLEPLYNDYRKLRKKLGDGRFTLTHVDEVIHELLTSDYSCDIALPRINKRWDLEAIGTLEPRISALDDDVDLDQEEKEEDHNDQARNNGDDDDHRQVRRMSPIIRDRDRKRDNSHRDYRGRDYDRGRGHERDRDCKYYGRERGRGRDLGRDRERRDRDRGMMRRRSHSRSRSRSRDQKDSEVADHNRKRHARSSASPQRRAEEYGGNAARDDIQTERKKKQKNTMKQNGTDHPDPEIAEQNRLRASLGLKPLRV